MSKLYILAVLFGAAGCELLAQPGINNASINGIVAPPVSTPIYPNQGVSIATVFQNQGAGLTYAFFTFETWPSPNFSCKVGVQVGSPVSASNVYLHDDNGNAFGGMSLGSGQQQDNSKCTLYSNGSNVTQSPDGSQYTVTVNVVFKDPFNGVKYIWVNGYDGKYISSGWYCPNAAFTVQSQDYAPQTLYVSPGFGSNQPGQTQQFSYTTSDPNGAFTMWHTELVFNQGNTWIPGYNPSRRCKIIQDSNFVSLENDGQNGYVNGGYAPLGSAQPISNSQCTIYRSMSGGTATSLQSQTIAFTVSFTTGFSGQLQDHIFASDNLGLSTWDTQANGSWSWAVGSIPVPAETTGILDIAIIPDKGLLLGYARTQPNDLSAGYGPSACINITDFTSSGNNNSGCIANGLEDIALTVPLRNGSRYHFSSSHSVQAIPNVFGCAYCGYSDPLGYGLLSGVDIPGASVDSGYWIWNAPVISVFAPGPGVFLGNLSLDLLTYPDPNAPQATFIYEADAGVAIDGYGDALPNTIDWNNLAQPSNPYYNTFEEAADITALCQSCPTIGVMTLPCTLVRAGPYVIGGAAVLINILKSQRGNSNQIDTGIQLDMQATGFKGLKPCEILAILKAEAALAGDTARLARITKTQKGFGCKNVQKRN